jgi:hypothetical protein
MEWESIAYKKKYSKERLQGYKFWIHWEEFNFMDRLARSLIFCIHHTEKKSKNQENWKKKSKKPNCEKNPTGSVRFRFYKSEIKKPNWTEPKLKKTEPNRKKTEPNQFELVFVLKNRTKTGRFEPVSVF